MNKSEIKTVFDGLGHHTYIVVATIDGEKIKTAHKFAPDAADRVAFLRRRYDCVTITKGW